MRLLLPALCLCGFALRLHLLSAWPFREDEAMYSVWALHLWRVDPLALTLWPDKPPLFLWLLGPAFQLFGPSEAAARLLNIAADTLTIAVVAAIGRVLWGQRAGFFAACAYALSPFAISFAPTAYTDPTLILWGMLSFYAALTRRGFWAGLFLAAAIATKQQGVLYVPLILGVIFLSQVAGGRWQVLSRFTFHAIRNTQYTIRNVVFGFTLLFLPVLLWDASRWSVAPSPWDLSVRNYAPLLLLPPGEWVARAIQWGEIAWFLAGSWWVLGCWGLGAGYWGIANRNRFSIRHSQPAILLIWSWGFVTLHIITSIQIWDRYLLPLAPVVALLTGWLLTHLTGAQGKRMGMTSGLILRACQVLVVALPLLLLPPALNGATGSLPVGGDHGDYAGLDESIEWLRANAPENAIVYHRDVSWQLRFAFFAASSAQPNASDFELRWFPNAVYLADNGAKTPERRKYLVEPVWAAVDAAGPRLQQRGIDWQVRLRTGNFTLYELTGPPASPCNWCLCQDSSKRQFARELSIPPSGHPVIRSSLP